MVLRLTEEEYAALLQRQRVRGNAAATSGAEDIGVERSVPVASCRARPGRHHEDKLAALLDALVIPYQREYRFAAPRKFRFDFVLLPLVLKLAVEIDGVVHRIDSRWRSDREKSNLALKNGWRVIHLGVDQIRPGDAAALIQEALLQSPIRSR